MVLRFSRIMKRAHTIFITGGERSGKSSFGEKIALEKSNSPIYLATAMVLDEEFAERVQRHKNARDERWQVIEEHINIGNHNLSGKVVVLDCITLWLTNIFYSHNKLTDTSLDFAKKEWEKFTGTDFTLIVISNELGMGVHGSSIETRRFTELQGWMNQYIAKMANEAYLMVSGLPIRLK